jgi:hypothetical protein
VLPCSLRQGAPDRPAAGLRSAPAPRLRRTLLGRPALLRLDSVAPTHHTLEDQGLFPHLRSADLRLRPVIDRLQQEHLTIHDVLEGVDQALVQFVSVPDGMAGLRAAVDLLSDALLSHLAYEERELVEPIARLGLQ